MRDASRRNAEIEIECNNIIATVRAGHLSDREGFDFYQALKDGNTEKAEAMRKMFQERLKEGGL